MRPKRTLSAFAPTTTQHAHHRAAKRLLLCILLCGSLVACSNDETADLAQYVKDIKAAQKSNIPPLPQPQQYETFIYKANALRNPFEAPKDIAAEEIKKKPGTGLQPDMSRQRDELERYNLASLKMVGSLEKDGKRWALILASDGGLHRVTSGHYIGQNNGQITKITETQLELREIVPDGLGGWIERHTTLAVNE